MFKEFSSHIAWTDSMKDKRNFVGLIEYQRKKVGGSVQLLWVINPNSSDERDAEIAAVKMLQQISDITANGDVIYKDGVML